MKKDIDSVSYQTARSQIQNGDVVFFDGVKNLVDRLIMFFTSSKYVHVGIAFWMETDVTSPKRLMIVEAQGGTNRRVINFSFYQNRNFDVFTSPISWDEMQDAAMEKIGTEKYGWITAVYVGLHDFLLKQYNIKIPKSNLPGEICSEFVARVLKMTPTEVSPQLLSETLLGMGCNIKIKVRKL